jgi:hypothetical protein
MRGTLLCSQANHAFTSSAMNRLAMAMKIVPSKAVVFILQTPAFSAKFIKGCASADFPETCHAVESTTSLLHRSNEGA